ncbi:MAG: hypothetical protein RMK91_06740 [Pseudanabaenaceae cyanobacterium SKYGB_i_bin29]|nr:hypothetical protein [Pseudanabaenaceae cyanobacterium SKYG29]MDW8421548.1 hypothetical protein [Pseudanabaenaceae cyanobacterium SKYGB_i_bin29]
MKEDDALVQFIRTYRLEVPPPREELEEKIIQQLTPRSAVFPWLPLLIGTVVVGAGLFGFARFRQWQVAQTELDTNSLEAALMQNWEVATARSEDSLSYLFTDQEDK